MFEYFPDNFQWTNTTIACITAGGNISEVDDACRPLKGLAKGGENNPVALEAWHESWKKVASRVEHLAARDEEAGNYLSAGRKYFRAFLYYQVAERHMTNLDPRKLQTYHKLLATFKKAIQLRREPVEMVDVPFQNTSLPALFIPALGGGKAPCMVHFDGFDDLKERIYARVGDEFRRRGISLLIVDNPGVGESLRLRNLHSGIDTEVPAGACVDYLESRPDIDPERIGIMAISLGGYYAPRAAAFEKRFKCCVAWGAFWRFEWFHQPESHTQKSVPDFQLPWVFGKKTFEEAREVALKMNLEGVADKITCPLLVVHGENDRIVPLWHAEKTIEAAVNSPKRELKVFTLAEGGAEHVQGDCPHMFVDYAADWVARILGGNPKGA